MSSIEEYQPFEDGDDGENDIQITEYDITATPNDFNVLTICSYIESGAISLPMFQRNFTWDQKRASKLIESLILGLPVPQTFLYEEKKNNLVILDGQQRLMSIFFFKKMRFPRQDKRAELKRIFMEKGGIPDSILYDDNYFTAFSLKLAERPDGTKSPFEGLNYGTLEENKSSFDLRPIRNVVIKQNEPKNDNSSIYEIFDRLNTGGVTLRPQEIRANLYFSKFYQMLYEVNRQREWRKFLRSPNEDQFMRDVELLLRAFGMLIGWKDYKPSMARFLNEFSHKAKKEFTDDFVSYLHDLFVSFLQSLSSLADTAFVSKTSGRFSIALFEAVFVAKCAALAEQRQAYAGQPIPLEEVEKIAKNPHFIERLQEGTTKQTHVTERMKIAMGVPIA